MKTAELVLTRALLAQSFRTGHSPLALVPNRSPLDLIPDRILPERVRPAFPIAEPEITVPFDPDLALVLAAHVLEWPVRQVSLARQVGRFAVVDYEAVVERPVDPDLMLCFELSPAAQHFHLAMRAFQKFRRQWQLNPGEWYRQNGEGLARMMGSHLWPLQPSFAEADFVARWALTTIARANRIRDGVD